MSMEYCRRISTLALALAMAATASLLLVSTTIRPRQIHVLNNLNRRLWLLDNRIAAQFSDPKSVRPRPPSRGSTAAATANRSVTWHANCQIVYVLGVEGSIHHGFMPVIRSLAESQVDPVTGTPYDIVKGHEALRDAIFGSKQHDLPLSDPGLVQSTLERMCPPPNESWKKRVVLEGNSFPSGNPDDLRLPFRVRRQRDWMDMTPEQIATSDSALNHPTNLYQFYDAYSDYVDIKFIVLNRPYLDTVASHTDFDKGPEGHSNVISGFLVMLSRFLMGHMYAAVPSDVAAAATGGDDPAVAPLWSIVCAEQLSSRQHETPQQARAARDRVLVNLAKFLGWPQRSCPRCFDKWKESAKTSPVDRMGEEATQILLEHAKALEGIWPPRRVEDDLPEQQCRM